MRRVRRLFQNPGPLVYGTLLVGAVIDAESFKLETFPETVAGIAITMVLIYLAHSYAQITGDRVQKGEHLTFGLVIKKLEHELPILTGAAVPLAAVVIGWVSGASLEDALTAGVYASAATLVALELIAALAAHLTGWELVIQLGLGVVLGLGILALKLVYH